MLEIEAHRHDAVRASRVIGGLRQPKARIRLEARLVGAGHAPQKIDLAVLERQDLCPGLGNDAHHDLIEARQSRLEVGRVAHQAQFGAPAIRGELERTGADGLRVGRVRLRVGALVDVSRDDRRLRRVELQQQGSVRLLEPEHHRALVGRVDAGEHAAHRGLGPRVVLQQHLLEREFHVGGREALAVVPGDVVAQMEAIDGARLLDRPARGQLGHGVAVLVAAEQPVVEQLRRRMRGATRRDRRVQVTGIGGERDDERAAARRRLLRAQSGRDRRDQQQGRRQNSALHTAPWHSLAPRWHSQSAAPHSPWTCLAR